MGEAQNVSSRLPRIDIRGNVIDNRIHVTRCAECGMGCVDAAEWHPWEACEVFKRTHDSREVWRMLSRRLVAGEGPQG